MKRWTVVILLAGAPWLAAADGPAPDPQRKDGLSWVQPSPTPPVATSSAVRGELPRNLRGPERPSGELAGLRALSLAEGRATVAIGGVSRTIRKGDRIGGLVVRAVGSDRIILDRPGRAGTAAAEPATIVVTFETGGEARVRTYQVPSAPAAPAEVP
jgi:hypothetical protein